jgi:hypothetical protein
MTFGARAIADVGDGLLAADGVLPWAKPPPHEHSRRRKSAE